MIQRISLTLKNILRLGGELLLGKHRLNSGTIKTFADKTEEVIGAFEIGQQITKRFKAKKG
ncbi:MAG: hypothetical protein AB1454_02665 [Candidatus Auribacterota bacterium]